MRLGLFSDIHGNREALAACLTHAARQPIDRLVFLGDYVGYGADPGWVVDQVEALVARGAIALLGNHDAAVLKPDSRMNAVARAAIDWTRGQLDARQRAFLAARPMTLDEDGRLFVHASACAPERWEYVLGPREAQRSLAATACRHSFCGHVHVPALFRLAADGTLTGAVPPAGADVALDPAARWLAVIGSVGQPRDGNPEACYALLDGDHESLRYVRVPYDVAAAAAKIRRAGLPEILARRLGSGF